MDFLYKLYSYNYFGIGLFIVITILAFAFLVILFFGKKDEKTRRELEKVEENREAMKELERKQEEEKKEELETFSLENSPEITREDLVERIVENEKTVEEQVPSFIDTFEEPSLDEQRSTISTYAQDDLDIDFVKDIALQREELNTKAVREENDTDLDIFNTQSTREYDLENEPISYEEVNRDVVEPYDYTNQEEAREQLREEMYNVEPDTRENTRRAMPSVFSSVYKNNERENIFPEETYQADNFIANLEPETYELKQEEPVEQVIEEPKTENLRPITPKKPEFVMPKRADMPKLNKNNDNNDSIIKF